MRRTSKSFAVLVSTLLVLVFPVAGWAQQAQAPGGDCYQCRACPVWYTECPEPPALCFEWGHATDTDAYAYPGWTFTHECQENTHYCSTHDRCYGYLSHEQAQQLVELAARIESGDMVALSILLDEHYDDLRFKEEDRSLLVENRCVMDAPEETFRLAIRLTDTQLHQYESLLSTI